MRARRISCAAVLVALWAAPGAPAAAAPVDGPLSVEVSGGGPLFDLTAIQPGATLVADVAVTNESTDAATLRASAVNVVGHDGCSPVEVKSGMPCGSGPGHLLEQVELTVEDRTDGSPMVVWSGNVGELEAVPLASADLAGGEARAYRFTAHLPSTSGNETQNDGLEFDLRFDLGMSGAGTVVQGTSIQPPGGVQVLGIVTLPRTGAELLAAVRVAAASLLVGAVIVRLARRRRLLVGG